MLIECVLLIYLDTAIVNSYVNHNSAVHLRNTLQSIVYSVKSFAK